jgi:hypothetical protein
MRCLLILTTVLALHTTALAAPEINVRIASVTDARERSAHTELVKRSLRALEARTIDVAVKIVVLANGQVSAKVDLVLSGSGGIRSIASGTSAFIAPRSQLRNQAALRKEALDHALAALHRKVRLSAKPLT